MMVSDLEKRLVNVLHNLKYRELEELAKHISDSVCGLADDGVIVLSEESKEQINAAYFAELLLNYGECNWDEEEWENAISDLRFE